MGIVTAASARVSGLVVAVDGGGTKTDAVALDLDGAVRARVRGPGSSPHLEGLERSVAVVDELVRASTDGVGARSVDLFLSGLDLPPEEDAYRQAVSGLPWAADVVVDNDLFALLRAGTAEPDAIAIVCGSGVNAVGVRRDGARMRFPSLGPLSGDWGGGSGMGAEALWHAARAVDGRGPDTALVDDICTALGAASIELLIEELHFERRSSADLTRLAPVVFAAADAGDAVAGSLVDRQADEVVAYARAILVRLGVSGVPVVLGGAILQAGHPRLETRIAAGIAALDAGCRLVRPEVAPVTGAALRALERAGARPAAIDRAAAELAAG